MKTEYEIAVENVEKYIEEKGRINLDFDEVCETHLFTLKRWLDFLKWSCKYHKDTGKEDHNFEKYMLKQKITDIKKAIAHYKKEKIK